MTDPKITLILGGARSGKSHHAERLAAESGRRVLYIATAEAKDADMAARIAIHQAERPAQWQTLEAPRQVGAQVQTLRQPPQVWLLDCLTMLTSNILLALEAESPAEIEAAVQAELDSLLTARQAVDAALIIVSNEVGLGIVPAYSLGRTYRDVLGRANQRLAATADRVLFMVAGIPMVVK